jgi:hypothetical protein
LLRRDGGSTAGDNKLLDIIHACMVNWRWRWWP